MKNTTIVLLLCAVLSLSACSSAYSPVQDIQKEAVVGYRVTAPEVISDTENLPAVDYTVIDEPKEIPQGAIVTPIKKLVRESVVNPHYQKGLETITAINSLNPTPTAPIVGLGVTLMGYILGGIAYARNGQTKKALTAVIQGVETVKDSAALKAIIERKSTLNGSAKTLHEAVKSVT